MQYGHTALTLCMQITRNCLTPISNYHTSVFSQWKKITFREL